MLNLSLDFFLCDYELGQTIVGSFSHTLHRVVLLAVLFLDKIYLCVGTLAKARDALEVPRRQLLHFFARLLVDVIEHICYPFDVLYYLTIWLGVVERSLFVDI